MVVSDEGPHSARIVLIGEAPGREEAETGRPFVGASGRLLMGWWQTLGLAREDVYITNVFRERPPGNKLAALPRTALAQATNDLHERLALLSDPYVIVPTGNTALAALTGHREITKHRGSIYAYRDRRGRDVKVIPTIHPAAVLWKYARDWAGADGADAASAQRGKDYEERCQLDWARIVADAAFRELRLPAREMLVRPTLSDALDFVREASRAPFALGIDVETPRHVSWEATSKESSKCAACGHPRKRHWNQQVSGACEVRKCVTCPNGFILTRKAGKPKRIDGDRYLDLVGFSYDPRAALVLSLDEPWALDVIRQLCALPVPKALQNGLFDLWWLARYDAPVAAFAYDTLCMHHCLHPKGDHDLAYLASVFTREPYWKEDHKTIDVEVRRDVADGDDRYRRYCGKDVCTTLELAQEFHARLAASGKLSFYLAHYAALFPALHRMSATGIRVDADARAAAQASFASRALALIGAIEADAGIKLTGKKGSVSRKKLAEYLYVTMALPKQLRKRASGKRTPSTDAAILRKLALQFPARIGPFVERLLEHEQVTKLGQFLADGKVDADGRSRCRYKLTTDTLRLASSENPAGTGMNHQNVPVRHGTAIRDCFVPDPGHVLVQVDLSQAEARVVYMLTDDPELHKIARSAPWEYDVHCRSMSVIFRERDERCRDYASAFAWVQSGDPDAKAKRHISKRGGHGAHYGLADVTLQEFLLADGYVFTTIECRAIIEAYFAGTPAVLAYQERTRHRVLYDGVLTTTWGWEWDFGADLRAPGTDKQEVYRRAYAFQPQNEVVSIMNHWGLEPLDAWIDAAKRATRILQQGHDSLLLSCPPGEAWDVWTFLRASLERPRRYAGRALTIPVDVAVGPRWGSLRSFKRPPSRAEFEAAVAAALPTERAA